ncbi:lipase family protein [Mesorhizobium sp. 113-3-3]|uniref:lipase family protein n=1 Tax=Mesorhizobium sp. 113-3-3 TaxID=2744516 RepID=UPI0019277415|nr:lipase family protein [Mesorhizobium sp. 113-3-3]BCG79487.1 hypothetical protein MesoLj113b_30290 [Mesorhizobium sp. 113-3-3]
MGIQVELAKICRRVYPGPLNQRQLTIAGEPIQSQRYIHGSFGRGYCRVFFNEASVVVAFRGTREIIDWQISNFRFLREPLRDCGPAGDHIGVHRGFQRTLDYTDKTTGLRSLEAILRILQEIDVNSRNLWITGHSLGGALATIFAAKLRHSRPDLIAGNLRGIVLFGAPAVGGVSFKRHYGALNDLTERYINNLDPVPFTPPIGFCHIGRGSWYRDRQWIPDPGWPTRLSMAIRHRPSAMIGDHSMNAYVEALSR